MLKQCTLVDGRVPVSQLVVFQLQRSGLTNAELAARSGLPKGTISRLMSGKHEPGATTLDKLRKAGLVVQVGFEAPKTASSR